MIAYLHGRILSRKANRITIDVGGVGYDVMIPISTFYELGSEGAEVNLHIHTHVREDALALYGFQTEQEKTLFERLLSVSGVGPRLAITILSGLEMTELVQALRKGDVATLLHMPGVGRKTAERLVLELREKLDDLVLATDSAREAAGRPLPAGPLGAVDEDVHSVLVNLGYTRTNAEAAILEVRRESPDGEFDDVLRASLRLLAGKFFSK
jgi:Holliday junction DNA helicase RuvA